MDKAIYDYTKPELVKQLKTNRPLNIQRPADLARITATLLLNHPEEFDLIKGMVGVMQHVYNVLPKNLKPKLPAELLKVSGDNKQLCKVNKQGLRICVGPSTVGPTASKSGAGVKTGGSTWTLIKNKAGKIFVRIGAIVVAGIVFAAFLTGGFVVGLATLLLSALIFSAATKKMIETAADIAGFIIKKLVDTAKKAAIGLGITNFLIYGGLFAGGLFLLSRMEK